MWRWNLTFFHNCKCFLQLTLSNQFEAILEILSHFCEFYLFLHIWNYFKKLCESRAVFAACHINLRVSQQFCGLPHQSEGISAISWLANLSEGISAISWLATSIWGYLSNFAACPIYLRSSRAVFAAWHIYLRVSQQFRGLPHQSEGISAILLGMSKCTKV